MKKTVFIFFLGLICFHVAKAQKQDSILVYMKNSGQMVEVKDSADYLLLVMQPPDVSTGVKISTIKEFNTDNTLRLKGKAILRLSNTKLSLEFVGICSEFYPNGKLKKIVDYKPDFSEDVKLYYPNGQQYAIEKHEIIGNKYLLTECCDTTGKVLCEKGNGIWLIYDEHFKHIIERGAIINGLKDGEWNEMVNDSIKYITIYKQGNFVSSTDPGRANGDQPFQSVEVEPRFKYGGPAGFMAFLQKTVKFPAYDREHKTQGKVVVSFVVQGDGSLTNIKILSSPSPAMADAAVEAVQQSPKWLPGRQNGQSVRVKYTISFAFNLGVN